MRVPSIKQYIKPQLRSINASQWANGKAIVPLETQIAKLPGPITHIMVHLPLGQLRDHIVSNIAHAKAVKDMQTVEMNEYLCGPHHGRTVEAGILPLIDTIGGADELMFYLNKTPEVKRFIMSGGGVNACVRVFYAFIVDMKMGETTEFYLSLDALFTFDKDKSNWKKMFYLVSGFFWPQVDRGRSTAVWFDDHLLAATSTDPEARIRIYSTAESMISALS